jgi:hypothetical protein
VDQPVQRLADFFMTEDGEPWAVFVYGHVDPASVVAQIEQQIAFAHRIGHIDDEWMETWELDPAKIQQLWIYTEDDAPEDAPYLWGDANSPGACPITGVRF